MFLLKSLGLKAWGYIALGFAIIGLVYKIYKSGGDARDVKALHNTLNAVRVSKEIEKNVDSLSDADVIKRLQDNGWFDTNDNQSK